MTVRTPPAAIPARNLNRISIRALSAKNISIHPKICGNAIKKIDFLRPILFAA